MLIVNHPPMGEKIKASYTHDELQQLRAFLQDAGAFDFAAAKTGLYPAAALSSQAAAQTGYGHVWVRDNVYVAHALALIGRGDLADRVALALARFYTNHSAKFFDIIDGARSHRVVMDRPHIRFNGAELIEVPESWAHAQNDALGYFLWFYLQRALAGAFTADAGLIEMFALYFERIDYARDADSGHWEERAKVEASSIGCVVAALRQVCEWRRRQGEKSPWRRLTDETLERLLGQGEAALENILPFECRGPDERLVRRYDAALLFLIYPLGVVAEDMGRRIFDNVVENLRGDYGVRRYLGDSYWTADYKQKLDRRFWTGDFSLSLSVRDKLAQPGEEAQWCLFDPILSVIASQRYAKTRAREDRQRQIFHFNRALGQLSGPDGPAGALRCPEAYYRENGRYIPNDHVPLLWTQANLLMAFAAMEAAAIDA
jgi:hypothetical protein